jgi:hypothetical protein
MVFNATFNNISVISRQSVLLVEEAEENNRPVLTCRKSITKRYHIVLYRVHLPINWIRTQNVRGDKH